MSDNQEALRLANALEAFVKDALLEPHGNTAKTAAELRRLHDLVTEDSILQRRQRDEIAQLKTELAEQARLIGMGSEREARLKTVSAELVEALREMLENGGDFTAKRDKARAALAKAEANK